MKLADSIDAMMLLDAVGAGDRDRAIGAILDHLAARSIVAVDAVAGLREAIVRRDELGPTGIGEGVAVPHAWHAGLDRMVAALGVSRVGIGYPSLDGEPVHIVLLILTPPDRSLEARKQATFGTWLHHLRDPVFRASLAAAESPEQIGQLLRRVDEAGS